MKNYRSMRILLFAVVLSLSAAFGQVAVAAQDTVFFILDASGSMWGQIDGKPKMAIAKEAMAGIVADLPDDLQVGLMAYGHRRKGDCADVETVVPVAPLNKKQLLGAVAGISPKGKTPLTASVLQAAQSLKKTGGQVTIILVSDGKESCEGDPCQMVAELKKKGIAFVLHVIGFDVGKGERQQLECMAKAGGGMYLPASNAGQLKLAAKQAVASSSAKKLPALIAQGLVNGKPAVVRVDVAKDGNELFSITIQADDPGRIPLEPGSYELTVVEPETGQQQTAGLVMEQADQKKAFDFSVGRLALGAIINGKPGEAAYDILAAGTEDVVRGGYVNPNEKEVVDLPPGEYDIKFSTPNTAGSVPVMVRGVKVSPGAPAKAVGEFGQGRLMLSAIVNGKPGEAAYDIMVAGTEDVIRGGYVNPDEKEVVDLPPGEYDIKFTTPNTAGSVPVVVSGVKVSPGAPAKAVGEFGQGRLMLSAIINGKPGEAAYDIMVAGTEDSIRSGYVNPDEKEVVELPPGEYDIKFTTPNTAGSVPVVVRGVKVSPGAPAKAVGEFGQGKLLVVVMVNGKPGEAAYDIMPAGTEDSISSGYVSQDEREMVELPFGQYDLKFALQDTVADKPVFVRGLKVSTGAPAKAMANLVRGVLSCRVTVNGRPAEAAYDILAADSQDIVGTGYIGQDEDEKVFIAPGAYDVVFTLPDESEVKPVTVKGLQVTPGKTVKASAAFKK